MHRDRVQILVGVVEILTVPSWAENSPYDIGDKTQMFIDKLLIRDTERVWFTQHQGKNIPAIPS